MGIGRFLIEVRDGNDENPLGEPDRLIAVSEGCTPYGFPRPRSTSLCIMSCPGIPVYGRFFWPSIAILQRPLASPGARAVVGCTRPTTPGSPPASMGCLTNTAGD